MVYWHKVVSLLIRRPLCLTQKWTSLPFHTSIKLWRLMHKCKTLNGFGLGTLPILPIRSSQITKRNPTELTLHLNKLSEKANPRPSRQCRSNSRNPTASNSGALSAAAIPGVTDIRRCKSGLRRARARVNFLPLTLK